MIPALFLAPRSNETSRANFIATLETGYPMSEVRQFLNDEEKGLLKDKEKVYIWGNQEAKFPSWKKMQIGDYVAFYAKYELVYVGRCIFKKESEDLARQLWGNVPGKDATWKYTFFLDEIRPIKIPIEKIQELGEYKEKMIVQGFMPLDEIGINKIYAQYGSLVSFFDAFSEGVGTREFTLLDDISKKEVASLKDLEGLDKIINNKNWDIVLKEYEQRNSEQKPEVITNKISKIKRCRAIVQAMKEKYNYKCQVCGFTFEKKNGGFYAELAHVEPVASNKVGVDKPSNTIVLCPNHHKMLDLGNLEIINPDKYRINNEIFDLKCPIYS